MQWCIVGSCPMSSKIKSPWWLLTVALALVGAILPFWSLVRGAGLSGSLNDAGFMAVLWGASPFVLPPVAAWIARRPWVRIMVVVLAAIAVVFGLTNYLVIQPAQDAAHGTASYFLLPIWQWPMALLGVALALIVPSAADEQRMDSPAAAAANEVP
ncbi:MAG TPA: hypothetical protein DCE44_22550 [Verrucomicrobiales bacterium]|nr:hypothetical protein [Verrucomicrobiales bacterium]